MGRRKAFTLIELLVVVAIIGVLAAMLFPVLAGARERARQASCASNMKQIGAAIQLYADNWDDTLPLQYAYVNNWSTREYWKILVDPYLKSRSVWVCPSNPIGADGSDDYLFVHVKLTAAYSSIFDTWPRKPYSYVQSMAFFDAPSVDIPADSTRDPKFVYPSRSLAEVSDSSGAIMVFEASFEYDFFPYGWGYPEATSEISDLTNQVDPGRVLGTWHHGGGNWLFGDEHIRWMTPRQTLVPKVLWMTDDPANPLDVSRTLAALSLYPQYR